MKLLAETIPNNSGEFMLIDQESGEHIPNNRPAVVTPTNFLNMRTATGQVRILANELPDTATDAEFAKFWEESKDSETKKVDKEVAVQSFLKSFGPVEAEATKKEPTKTASK